MTIQVKEATIAGSPNDFMEVRHVALRGTNREIGCRIAEIARGRFDVQLTPAPDAAVLRASREYLQQHYPIHYQRMLGVSDAYRTPIDDERLDLSRLAYLFAFPGCSVAYIPPDRAQDGHALFSRNYDFTLGTASQMVGLPPQPDELPISSRPYLFEIYPDEGYASIYMCVYDLLSGCADGINSEGLTVALLADDESMAKYPVPPTLRPAVGLHEPQTLRLLLDTCATVEEAKRALLLTKKYHNVIPAHYIVSDRFGNSFVWESSPPDHREHIMDGEGDIQVVTNHLLYQGERPTPEPTADPGWTFARYQLLREALPSGRISAEGLKNAHSCVNFTPAFGRKMMGGDFDGGDSQGARDLGRTLWHALYDIDERRVQVKFYLGDSADGQNRYSGYKEFRLKP
jgi:hypothetical protein